jgi:putative membrane protein
MSLVAIVLTALVLLVHAWIVVLEMVLWDTPRGRAAFGTTPELAAQTTVLAANQGLYNGFLVAGLALALFGPEAHRFAFAVFALSCVVVAGVYGAATASRRILWVQAVPGLLALGTQLLAHRG